MAKISEFVSGSTVNATVMVANISPVSTPKMRGKVANRYTFQDDTGTIEYMDWDNASDLKQGSLYDIVAVIGAYQGTPQVSQLRSYTARVGNAMEFARKSQVPLDVLKQRFERVVSVIEHPLVNHLVEEMLGGPKLVGDTGRDFGRAPAARTVHNAWVHGLLEHAVQMAELGIVAYQHYRPYFPDLDLNKILFGCLCHDWGKIHEYDINNPAYPHTRTGELLPHQLLGPLHVAELCERADYAGDHDEHGLVDATAQFLGYIGDDYDVGVVVQYLDSYRDELIHILAAHHGKLEYGSAVEPKTVEALIVHHLDIFDGKLMHVHSLMEKPVPAGASTQSMTERSFFEKVAFVRQRVGYFGHYMKNLFMGSPWWPVGNSKAKAPDEKLDI